MLGTQIEERPIPVQGGQEMPSIRFFFFDPYPLVLTLYFWAYSRLSTQATLLAGLGGPYGMQGVKLGSDSYKLSALHAVLSL